MSRALRVLERDLAATRQTRAAVAAGEVVDREDPAVHATDDSFLNRPTLFDAAEPAVTRPAVTRQPNLFELAGVDPAITRSAMLRDRGFDFNDPVLLARHQQMMALVESAHRDAARRVTAYPEDRPAEDDDACAAADAACHAMCREALTIATQQAAQAVAVQLPDELAAQVGDFAVDATCLPRDELCACRDPRPGHSAAPTLRHTIAPRFSMIACAKCGRCRSFVSSPGALAIAAGPPPSFAPSRHFVPVRHMTTFRLQRANSSEFAYLDPLEDGDESWTVPGGVQRHPASQWHNFRGAIGDEWVSGTARYEVQLTHITRGAVAVGVCSAGAKVNDSNHWLPGGELETCALISGNDEVTPGLYGRLRCDEGCPVGPRCLRCANGVHLLRHTPCRTLQAGDVVAVSIAPPDVHVFLNGAPVGHLPAPRGRLRLCVGLMFARDEVRVSRL